MRYRALLTLLLFFPSLLCAQNWTQRYNSSGNALDESKVILPASNGASIVVGSSFSSQSGWDVTAIQYDANGNPSWTNPFSFNSPSNSDDKATCAARDVSGNIYIGGYSWRDSTGWDYLLIKLNTSGQQQWVQRINSESTNNDLATAIALDTQGNVYLTGHSMNISGVENILTMTYDPSGNQLWSKRYNASSTVDEKALSVEVDASNNIIITGEHHGATKDILLIKYNASGVEQWTKTLKNAPTGDDEVHAMTIDTLSNIYLVGATMPQGGMHDALVMKINPDGSSAWMKTYNGTGNEDDYANAVQVDATGNVIVTASSKGTTTGNDIATIKYKADGTQDWVSRYDGGGTAPDNAAPRFAGATAGRAMSSTSAIVTWATASDDQTVQDDIEYLIFVATTSGGQNFSSPTKVVKGIYHATLDNLQSNKDYFVVVRARDAASISDANTREIKIHTLKPPLTITTTSLPTGTVGAAYEQQLNATGGQGAYTWSLISGLLPTGLSLDASGKISGTPTKEENENFIVRVSDATGDTTSKEFTLSVKRAPLTITTTALPDAYPGQPYNATLSAANGKPPYTWSLVAGNIPWGLKLTDTGIIQDTARDDGTYSFTVQVKDANNDSTQKNLSLNCIGPPALIITQDTAMQGGVYWYSRIFVSPGVTATITGDIVLNATDSVLIAGNMISNCSWITISTSDKFTISGLITNKNQCDSIPPHPGIIISAVKHVQIGIVQDTIPVLISAGTLEISTIAISNHLISIPESSTLLINNKIIKTTNDDEEGNIINCGGSNSESDYKVRSKRNIKIYGAVFAGVYFPYEGRDHNGRNNAWIIIEAPDGNITVDQFKDPTTAKFADFTTLDGENGKGEVSQGCPVNIDLSNTHGGNGGSIAFSAKSVDLISAHASLGDGGRGASVEVKGDKAGDCIDGCDAWAAGGNGGNAGLIRFYISDPNQITGKFVVGGAEGGWGGNADAIASKGGDCNVCPRGDGGKGGFAKAQGGKGGDAGENTPHIEYLGGFAGDGGMAFARGGDGGKGATCCDPDVRAGHGGNGYKDDKYNAYAIPGKYGEIGKYKNMNGTCWAYGGNGGNGGDGIPFGLGGIEGYGKVESGNEAYKGLSGRDGYPCNYYSIFIHQSTIPPLIKPGVIDTIDIGDTLPIGTIHSHFLTNTEFGMSVSYTKNGSDIMITAGGWEFSDAKLIDTTKKIFAKEFRMTLNLLSTGQKGSMYLRGMKGGQQTAEVSHTVYPSDHDPIPLDLIAPNNDYFDAVVFGTYTPVKIIANTTDADFKVGP